MLGGYLFFRLCFLFGRRLGHLLFEEGENPAPGAIPFLMPASGPGAVVEAGEEQRGQAGELEHVGLNAVFGEHAEKAGAGRGNRDRSRYA